METSLEALQRAGLSVVSAPVPAALGAAWGYGGGERWVAFYCDAESGEMRYDDGEHDEDANWDAWALFLEHPRVAPTVDGLRLGHDFEKQTPGHFLLLDRRERRLFAGPMGVLERLLRPVEGDDLALSREPWAPDGAETIAAWVLEAALLAWLDSLNERSI